MVKILAACFLMSNLMIVGDMNVGLGKSILFKQAEAYKEASSKLKKIYENGCKVEVAVGVPEEILDKRGVVGGTIVSNNRIQSKKPSDYEEREFFRYVKGFVMPHYPTEALENKLQGKVYVKVFVKANGDIERVSFVGGEKILKEAIVEAFRYWEHAKSGYSVVLYYTFTFSLPDTNK